MAEEEEACFEIWQGGELVAGCTGPRASAQREAHHYAFVYSQDGPVEVREVEISDEEDDEDDR